MSSPKQATSLITIDVNEVAALADKSGELIFTPEAEDALVKLLQMQEMVNAAIEFAKEKIAETGEEMMPGFSGVASDKVKVSYRQYGGKYGFEQSLKDEIPEEFIKTTTTTRNSVVSKEVEKFVKEKGGLPNGIYERPRAKKMSIELVENYKILPPKGGKDEDES